MISNRSDWKAGLSMLIIACVKEFRTTLTDGEAIAQLDLGCYPWHGLLELSALTEREANDPNCTHPGEAASWKYYNFAASLPSWTCASELGAQMKDLYYKSDANRSELINDFLRVCAEAMTEPAAAAAIQTLNSKNPVRVSVIHPDTGKDFSVR
ncbi:MAG: hypothetical protein C5B53_03555 [Candidatus Melainabacteria bacterium]|nr:MAG: hypothetical protein C5B53_03555 [Candidatus Melainabacteria bacterium]